MRRVWAPVVVLVVLVACSGKDLGPPILDPDRADAPGEVRLPTPSSSITISPGAVVSDTCSIKPGADCRDADLHQVSLAGADLRGADLRGAYLYGADMRDADLRGADLAGADLRNAALAGANLQGSFLKTALFAFANLAGADLEGADANTAQFDRSLLCDTIDPSGKEIDLDCGQIEVSPAP